MGGASLDFYPYYVIEYKLEMSKNDPSGKKHNIQNREMVIVDAFNGELLSLSDKKRKKSSYTAVKSLGRWSTILRALFLNCFFSSYEAVLTCTFPGTFCLNPICEVMSRGRFDVSVLFLPLHSFHLPAL